MALLSMSSVAVESQTTGRSSDVVGTELTHSNYALDEFAHQQFCKNRKVIIQNVPRVTYDEVKAYMGRFAVSDIAISKRLRHAIVTLKHGEEAESAVLELSGVLLRGCNVEIGLYRGDNLLCVTALPSTLCADDDQFKTFVETFGPVEKCFLMRSLTGQCKGYGFVEFAHNHEKSELARRQLDGMSISGSVLGCQFVPPSCLCFTDLHSRCLLVTDIPADISSTAAVHSFFKIIAAPVFFQLSRSTEQLTTFAVVEYSSAAEAEQTVVAMETSRCLMSITFCAPGESAADIFKQLFASKDNVHHPVPNLSGSKSWNSIISPVIPSYPPPIVIAPTDPQSDVEVQCGDVLNTLAPRPATIACLEAPAVAAGMKNHGKVPRPITGRGCRDQLPAAVIATAMSDRVLKVIQPQCTSGGTSQYSTPTDNISRYSVTATVSSADSVITKTRTLRNESTTSLPAVGQTSIGKYSVNTHTLSLQPSSLPTNTGSLNARDHVTNSGDMIGCCTPGVNKRSRRPHFVASPEPSPEGGYVGQHSQGIGGHYAESYLAKRRRKL